MSKTYRHRCEKYTENRNPNVPIQPMVKQSFLFIVMLDLCLKFI